MLIGPALLALKDDARFAAEVEACVNFLQEHNLIATAKPTPTSCARNAAQWAQIVGTFNHVYCFRDELRPHTIRPLAFMVAAQRVGLVDHAPDRSDDWPLYAITQAAYRRAGFSWPTGAPPLLESEGRP